MTTMEKIEELLSARLRWFGHMERIDDKRAPVKAKSFVVNDAKRGRLKKGWKEAMEKYMLARVLEKSDAQYCAV